MHLELANHLAIRMSANIETDTANALFLLIWESYYSAHLDISHIIEPSDVLSQVYGCLYL